jgi:citrate/tricarballylate utilization protein
VQAAEAHGAGDADTACAANPVARNGPGSAGQDDRFTLWRRRFHHFTFYGFMLCFASTCVATLYHYLFDLHAPYALTSLPVLLGTAGGSAS